jgi:hypothetical protein
MATLPEDGWVIGMSGQGANPGFWPVFIVADSGLAAAAFRLQKSNGTL